jgi:hypothetical protein
LIISRLTGDSQPAKEKPGSSLRGCWRPTSGTTDTACRFIVALRVQHVKRTYLPLSKIRAAHEYLEKSQMFGKIVLNP